MIASGSTNSNDTLLEVKDLRTYFYLDEGTLKAVDGVDLTIGRGQTLAVIGESGSGKSVTARSILRIVPRPGKIASGEILLHHTDEQVLDLTALPDSSKKLRAIRGKDISMIFQEPMTSLSPVHTIGNQIVEGILLHKTQDRHEARRIALDMIEKVGISNPAQRIDEYPHQLSGGMRQRAMIAMALACDPALLIADEPTTALDVTVQAQILDLMRRLQREFGMAILYITHDLGVVAEIADEVDVMYLGRVVEAAETKKIFQKPRHPYTIGLLKSIPKLGKKAHTRLDAIEGTVPLPLDMPPQCGFYSRCPRAIKGTCDRSVPVLAEIEPGHKVRCFLYSDQKEEVV